MKSNLGFFVVSLAVISCSTKDRPAHSSEIHMSAAEHYITHRLGGVTSVVENVIQSYTTVGWSSPYSSTLGFVTHDQDGTPSAKFQKFVSRLKAEIRTNIVHAALRTELMSLFTTQELLALNDLSPKQYEVMLKYNSKEYFKRNAPLHEHVHPPEFMPPVGFTKEEVDTVEAFPATAQAAMRKLNELGTAFNRAIAEELQRSVAAAKQEQSDGPRRDGVTSLDLPNEGTKDGKQNGAAEAAQR